MSIKRGEVFAIETKVGYGFLQYIEDDGDGIPIIRVLESVKKFLDLSQAEVNIPERYTVHFVLKIAFRKKLVVKVGQ